MKGPGTDEQPDARPDAPSPAAPTEASAGARVDTPIGTLGAGLVSIAMLMSIAMLAVQQAAFALVIGPLLSVVAMLVRPDPDARLIRGMLFAAGVVVLVMGLVLVRS